MANSDAQNTQNSEQVSNKAEIKTPLDETQHPSNGAENPSPITKEEEKCSLEESYKEKYVYALAETENLKKRLEREKTQMVRFANESILRDLVEVVDNFERTTQALAFDQEEKIKNISIGIDMVKKQFIDALARHGLEPIISVGRDFDPNLHEAVGQEVVEGKRDQEIIREYQKGYLLNGRLVRASKVIVAQKVK